MSKTYVVPEDFDSTLVEGEDITEQVKLIHQVLVSLTKDQYIRSLAVNAAALAFSGTELTHYSDRVMELAQQLNAYIEHG